MCFPYKCSIGTGMKWKEKKFYPQRDIFDILNTKKTFVNFKWIVPIVAIFHNIFILINSFSHFYLSKYENLCLNLLFSSLYNVAPSWNKILQECKKLLVPWSVIFEEKAQWIMIYLCYLMNVLVSPEFYSFSIKEYNY